MAINFVPKDYVISPYLESGLFSGMTGLGEGVGAYNTPAAEKLRRDNRTARIEAVLAGDPEFRNWAASKYRLFVNPNLAEGQTTPEFIHIPIDNKTSLDDIKKIPGLKGAMTDWQEINPLQYNPSTFFKGKLPAFKQGGKVTDSSQSKPVPIMAHSGERVIQANADQVPGLGNFLDQLIVALRKMPSFAEGGKVKEKSVDYSQAKREVIDPAKDDLFEQLYAEYIAERANQTAAAHQEQGRSPLFAQGGQSLATSYQPDDRVGLRNFFDATGKMPDPTLAGRVLAQMPTKQPNLQGRSMPGNGFPGLLAQFPPSVNAMSQGQVTQETQPTQTTMEQTPPVTTKPTVTKKQETKTTQPPVDTKQPETAGNPFRYISPLGGGAMLDPTTNDLGTLINHELARGIPVTEVGGKTSTQQQQEKIANVISLKTGIEENIAAKIANDFNTKTAGLREQLLKAQVEIAKIQASGAIKTDPLAQMRGQLIAAQIKEINDRSDQALLNSMQTAFKNGAVKEEQYTKTLLPIILKRNPMLLGMDIATLRKTLGENKSGWWTDESALKGFMKITDQELQGMMATAFEAYAMQQQLQTGASNVSNVTGISFSDTGYNVEE